MERPMPNLDKLDQSHAHQMRGLLFQDSIDPATAAVLPRTIAMNLSRSSAIAAATWNSAT